MQIFADGLGRTVVTSAEPEVTSRGAALLGLRGLGAIPGLDALPADGALYEPNTARHIIYHAPVARQRWLYDRVICGMERVPETRPDAK